MTKYYNTQRPIGPGTYPKPQDNKVIEIKNFDKKEKIENENISAYGYIKYEKPLMPAAAKAYELTLALAQDETKETIEVNKKTEQPITNLTAMTDEKIIEAAIKKIQEQQDGWNDILKNFLLEQIPKDIQLAKGILEPLKNLKTCNNYLGKWAKEKMEKNAAAFNVTNGNIRGCALTSDEVFSEAIHYFIDIKEEKLEVKPIKPASTKPTISNRPTLTTTSVTKKEKIEAQYACSLFD